MSETCNKHFRLIAVTLAGLTALTLCGAFAPTAEASGSAKETPQVYAAPAGGDKEKQPVPPQVSGGKDDAKKDDGKQPPGPSGQNDNDKRKIEENRKRDEDKRYKEDTRRKEDQRKREYQRWSEDKKNGKTTKNTGSETTTTERRTTKTAIGKPRKNAGTTNKRNGTKSRRHGTKSARTGASETASGLYNTFIKERTARPEPHSLQRGPRGSPRHRRSACYRSQSNESCNCAIAGSDRAAIMLPHIAGA